MKLLPSDIKSPWHFDFVVWALGNLLAPDHRNFDTKKNRHSVTIIKGSEIIDMIRLDIPKFLFVANEIQDPVVA